MKSLFFVLVLALSSTAYAGSASCTNTSALSWSQSNPYHNLSSFECVVTASQADAGTTSLLAYLPSAPSAGDEFTLKDGTDFSLDSCDSYYQDPVDGGDGNTYGYCQPAGVGLEAVGDALIDSEYYGPGSQSVSDSEFYLTSCDVGNVAPGTSPCTAADLPSYYADYAKRRYQLKAVFNGSSGNWDLVRSAAE